MSTQQQFEKFRENFLLSKVMVYEDEMVYKVRRGLAKAVANDANELIGKLGLDLVADAPKSLANDTIVISYQFGV